MTAINRAPLGWLGFLGIKNFGRNPSTAADILAPTWELSDLYLGANRRFGTTTGTINTVGTFPLPAVPAGQVWQYRQCAFISNVLAAGNTLHMMMQLYNVAQGQPIPIAGTGPTVAAVVGGRCVAALAQPIFVQPGDALALYVVEWTGANINYTCNFAYTILDA